MLELVLSRVSRMEGPEVEQRVRGSLKVNKKLTEGHIKKLVADAKQAESIGNAKVARAASHIRLTG
jgi:hypothetical protein